MAVIMLYRLMEKECMNFNIKLTKPKNVDMFMKSLKDYISLKKKSENVLLDEVENDLEVKEKFVLQQTQTLVEMTTNRNALIESRCVL